MDHQIATQNIDVSSHYYFRKALAFMQAGMPVDTTAHIDSAIIFSSHSPFYIYQKIKLLLQLNDAVACNSYIATQLNYLYKHASLYITCKVLYYYQKINDFSYDDFKALLVQNEMPDCLATEYMHVLEVNESHWFPNAKKAFKQDNFLLCIDYCTLISKRKHATFESLYLAACSYHMLGELHKACEYYKKCIELNSEYDIAYNDLGLALMELNLFDAALENLNMASYLHPGNIDYLSHIGECYYSLKQYKLAQEAFENIIKIYPSRLQTYFNLSHICKKRDKKRLSKKYMKTVKKRVKK